VVTLGGVVLVVMAKRGGGENHFVPKRLSLGIFFGVMGALCNALGLVFSKIGMVGSETSAMNTLFVRLASAAIASWVLGFFAGFSQKAIKEWPGWKMTGLIFAGALCGPLLSVWLALIAIRYTYTGVATTIMALAPIMVIPFAQITHKEKITWQMILGTVIAIAGVAILFLVD
jgi:drug/metabolite transporter (DMT)-like permease